MKMYAKNGLKYKNGLIVTTEGDVVGVDNEVVDLANEIETAYQKAVWLKIQPSVCAGPDYSKFERKTETVIEGFVVDTPIMDKKVEEAQKLMEEIDSVQLNETMNNMLAGLTPLVYFVTDDDVLSCENAAPHHFDCPMLGNPLEWTMDTLINAVAIINGVEVIEPDAPVVSE